MLLFDWSRAIKANRSNPAFAYGLIAYRAWERRNYDLWLIADCHSRRINPTGYFETQERIRVFLNQFRTIQTVWN